MSGALVVLPVASTLARAGADRLALATITLFRAGFCTAEIAVLFTIDEAEAMALLALARGDDTREGAAP